MKALGYSEQGPVTATGSVVEFETADPQPGPTDLLVEVRGVSVNPVDFKVRANRPPPEGDPRKFWVGMPLVLLKRSALM